MDTCTRTHIDHVVRRVYRFLVMLDDDDRVAHIPQIEQRIQQPAVVPLVQPDGGFVEHVHHTHETGADLACQANALGFAAGERVGGPIKSQIVETDVYQELKALIDLF